MYKAALVDDENFDLLGLQRLIPWEALNIEIVYSSNKPLAALNYIHEHELDILVTDIKMPVMSGLELAKIALQAHQRLKVVFISGYEDFHYAKQAMVLKADGYILKPVDDDEIIAALKAIVACLDAQRLQENERLEDASASLDSIKQHKSEWKLLPDIEEYVKTHLSGEITLKEAASRFSYSANHFGFLFKEQVGTSFNDYVVQERMNKAKGLLRQHGFKVYEIADQVGYKSLTYFSRVFKETFGMTPGDYRKQS
jgi:two-component system response regulator YesN